MAAAAKQISTKFLLSTFILLSLRVEACELELSSEFQFVKQEKKMKFYKKGESLIGASCFTKPTTLQALKEELSYVHISVKEDKSQKTLYFEKNQASSYTTTLVSERSEGKFIQLHIVSPKPIALEDAFFVTANVRD
ncbi:MAG: hypothetical protein AB7F59_08580 [Bdellovibrionales bacterium]